jgi:hypothetical protein
MTTLIINDETKEGKAFVEYALKLPFVKSSSKRKDLDKLKNVPNKTTLKAMHEAQKGKIIKTKNVNDLIDKLNS